VSAPAPRRDGTCFFEADPDLSLLQRATAEAVGTFLLVFTVVSAGLVWASQPDVGPIGRALSVGPILTGLILVFGQVSGGHYNPLISLSQWFGRRRSGACLAGYVAAQIVGAGFAAKLAILVFGAPARVPVVAAPVSAALLAAELFATAGLMIIVLAAPRMRPEGIGPFAVGGWVAMTIVGLPTGPAANPAITLAVLFAGLVPAPVALAHLAAEIAGLFLALGVIAVTSPHER
jgi:glycerol uptake facilitator-like aquaporin